VRPIPFLLCLALVGGCAGDGAGPSTTAGTPTTAPAGTTASTATTVPPEPCPPAPYELAQLPGAVAEAEGDSGDAEPDEFTSIGGTHTRLWVDVDGEPAIALVRGSLPPNQFPAERGEVTVGDSQGVAGPYPDGRWVVAWFNEPGDRCDEYTMVFYPPISPQEVESTLEAMRRVPG
jgi:hypothetical protein